MALVVEAVGKRSTERVRMLKISARVAHNSPTSAHSAATRRICCRRSERATGKLVGKLEKKRLGIDVSRVNWGKDLITQVRKKGG